MKEEEKFLTKLAQTIQKSVIDHLHIVGDIFDRGTQAAKVMDRIMDFSSVDIQWGNHDILWIGAYCGSEACLLTLLRIAARYNYLFELEKEYGLNLRPLFSFAHQTYQKNPVFAPKNSKNLSEREQEELEKSIRHFLSFNSNQNISYWIVDLNLKWTIVNCWKKSTMKHQRLI